ncbi:MAG: PPC domain-containing protein, partial [Pirellulales bacterium]|nr:PPC domain-containing protein [Pirellulales bacterium]
MKTHAERRNQIAFADKRFSSASRRLAFELLEARLHLSAGPDVFETDNDCDHASSISIGGTAQAHSIHEATDVDWVRFTLTQVSRVTLETGGAAGDTKLWLFRSGQCGWSEAISYDYDSGVGYFSKIEEYLEPGDYFAAVTEEGQSTTIESYTLTVTAVGLANKKDAYEDDNTVQAAQPIASGATQVHSLHVPYDVDWVTFSVSQASRATLTATGGAGRVALRLFGPNDPARQISYDYYPDGAVLAEVVVYLQPGVYHASVGSYYQDGALDGYALGLNLVPLTDLDDGFEPDNDAANATQLFLDGTPQPHSIHQPSDVDWTTFQLAAPARVAIETDGLEGDTWMALYASTNLNTPIATDFDSGNGEFSRIVAFLDPGTYYVRVQESYQDATIDSYILSAVSVALADLDDDFEDDGTSAAAKQIQANAPAQEHSIHRPTDVDWCWFTITAPSRVILETE